MEDEPMGLRGDAEGNPKTPGTIYDDIFRKMVQKHPEWFLHLINYAWGTNYPPDTKVEVCRNEYMELAGKIITDAILQVGDRYFLFELQSNPDGTMLIRLLEYSFAIAKEAMRADGTDVLQLPAAAAVYLRDTQNTPNEMTVKIRNPEGEELRYRFKIIKVQHITEEELFSRKLLLLLPYYLMRYEKQWKHMEQDPAAMEAFLAEWEQVVQRMQDSVDTDASLKDLGEMMLQMGQYLLRDHGEILKGVEDAMVARLQPLTTDRITAELEKKYAPEIARQAKELKRKDAEIARQAEEGKRKDAENARQAKELKRKDAEIARLMAIILEQQEKPNGSAE